MQDFSYAALSERPSFIATAISSLVLFLCRVFLAIRPLVLLKHVHHHFSNSNHRETSCILNFGTQPTLVKICDATLFLDTLSVATLDGMAQQWAYLPLVFRNM